MTTLVSLFDGIGGFCLAFQRAGAQIVATVEIDVAAAGVSRRHFPNAAQFDDIRNVSADDLRAVGFVPERGIVTAGWPCQDFSVAGRRAGLDGARSGLWWEVARILAELRPRWFLGENVPGLLSSVCTPECEGGCMETHGGAMGAVLGSLADLGYGVAYRVLDAQHFGVPQRRERVFIVGHLGAPWTAPAEVLFEPESSAGDSEAGRTPWPHIAPCLESGSNSTGGTRPPGTTVDTAESLVVVPALVARYALRAGDGGSSRQSLVSVTYTPHVAAPLTAGTAASPGVNPPGRRKEDDVNIVAFSHTAGIDIQASESLAPTIKAGHDTMPSVHTDTIVRRLTELECERLQGYPDGWTDGQSGSARYRQLGNSVAVPVVEWIARRLMAVDRELGA